MSLRLAAVAVIAMLMVLPMQAQLPTMSDVSPDKETAVAGPLPQWDVAVIKPHPAGDPGMSWQITADGLSLRNLPLEQMLCSAWDMKPYQISGLTGWMKGTSFDLTAKVSSEDAAVYEKLSMTRRRTMLQQLLTERFQLKVHTETKTLPVYELVVDKGGSKLKVSTALEPPSEEEAKAHPEKYKRGGMSMGAGMFEGTGVKVVSLASQLANTLGKPVQDKTGLTGIYDISLHYRREESNGDSGAPSLFSAVQEQLGLKLVAAKGPVVTLVVDGAQRPEGN
jgi:uncharacterized protein (TIGR03435 family)